MTCARCDGYGRIHSDWLTRDQMRLITAAVFVSGMVVAALLILVRR